MIRTQIYIPEELHVEAKMIAKQGDESLANLFRRLLTRYIVEEKQKMKPKSLVSLTKLKFTLGPKDLSTNMDKYLYQR